VTAFAILVKSHGPDLAYAQRLLASIHVHNRDDVPVYLVVPETDLGAFGHLEHPGVALIAESELSANLVRDTIGGYSPGYINQEIVKLSFWELGLAENYLCMDSDAQFVRDFHVADFMADETTPYTFLTDDRDLQSDPAYFSSNWVPRSAALLRIARELDLDDSDLRTVHGHAVFSSTVLQAFRDQFLKSRGWSYADALAVAPYEPTWYNFWLRKDQTIPILTREPIIKTVHDVSEYLDYSLRGVTDQDVARAYVAIVLNSNFSRGDGLVSLSDAPAVVLGRYLPMPVLSRLLGSRALLRLTRQRRAPGSPRQ